MKIRCIAAVFCLVLSGAIGGCDFRTTVSSRSGTVTDDYVEEPLASGAKKYENALKVSNAILDGLRSGRARAIHAEYFDPRLRQSFSEAEFIAFLEKINSYVGPLKQYKRMQWGFAPREEGGDKRLISTKIVEHERGMAPYHFVFEDDGKYEKLIALRIKERTGVAEPGQ